MTLDTKTARLLPRRRSSQSFEDLASRAAGGLAILLDEEARLVGVAFLGRVMATHGSDRSGRDVVVAAALKVTRRCHGSDASGSSVALGQSGRSHRANAQDDSSNSRSNASVHGTIHLGLRGLRRMAAGRDLFSDLDLEAVMNRRPAKSLFLLGRDAGLFWQPGRWTRPRSFHRADPRA
jgi:hypothetical protein